MDHVRLLFITLLALADREGVVYGSRNGLMRAAMIDLDAADEHDPWRILMGPDDDSSDLMRNPDNEGRRLEEVPGGFRIINYTYYKGLRDSEDRRVQNQEAQRRHREKVSPDKPVSATVSHRNPIESKSETKTKKEDKRGAQARPTIEQVIELIGETAGRDFFDYYESNGWRVGRNPMKSWKAAAHRWKRNQHIVNPTRPSFGRPKERAPSYPKMSETRECSDEERERVLKIAAEEKEKLRLALTPNESTS